jgi:LmbE family N-acetylglucosaminyl deacetylase
MRMRGFHVSSPVGFILSLAAAPAAAALPAMPPIAPTDSLLIVAPHPDDESLCCAGLIHSARQAGAKVAIVWITDGDAFRWDAMVMDHAVRPRPQSYRRLASIRAAEARTAARDLGVPPGSTYFLGFPDRGVARLMGDHFEPRTPWRSRYTGARSVIYPDAYQPGAPYDGASLTRDFAAILERVRPTLVFAPSLRDTHPDHRGAGLLVYRTLAARGELGELRYWIVHGGPGWPQRGFAPGEPQSIAPRGAGLSWQEFRLADASIAAKLQAISVYQSQLQVMGRVMRRYVRATELYAPAGR